MESALFKIQCKNCSATLNLNTRGELNCPYCGAKIYLNDKDFDDYLRTRDEILAKEKFKNDAAFNDGDVLDLWGSNLVKSFETTNGKTLRVTAYFADENILIGKNKIAYFCDTNPFNKQLVYPSADIKGLSRYLPSVISDYTLKEPYESYGNKCVLISKPENAYPLSFFGGLNARTVAWIISRFENLCCLFAFNEIDFTELHIKDFYINPKSHELYMLGGFEYYIKEPTNTYLYDIRNIALRILDKSTAPELCLEFLNNPPEKDAFADFKKWDNVIEKGFGGHNFYKDFN